MKQIVCMKWGPLYPAEYANKLYGMVRRNIQGPVRYSKNTITSKSIFHVLYPK